MLQLLLRRQGFAVNHKKLYRIYRKEKLVVRKRGGRKRSLGLRAPMTLRQLSTNAGRSTSCRTPSRMDTASGFCAWPTTLRVSA